MSSRLSHYTTIALIVIVAIIGLGLLIASFIPFSSAKSIVDTAVVDGEVTLFTPEFYTPITEKARIIAVGVILIAIALFTMRQRIERVLDECIKSFIELWSHSRAGVLRIYSEDRRSLIVLGVITICGAIVRLLYISQPMRNDEAGNYLGFGSLPVYILITAYHSMQNHPLNALLGHISIALFGNDPWVHRLPHVVVGTITIPAVFLLARRLYNPTAGLIAAATVAASHPMILYSTNARGYSLIALIFVITFSLVLHLKDNNNIAGWLLFSIFSAIGFYSIPTFLYPYTVILTFLVLSAALDDTVLSRDPLLLRIAIWSFIAALFTAILYSPMVLVTGISAFSSNYVLPEDRFNEVWELGKYFRLLYEHWTTGMPSAITIVLIVGFTVSLVFHNRIAFAHRIPIAISAVIGLIAVVFIHAKSPYPYQRTWLFLFPIVASISAGGVSWLLECAVSRFSTRIRQTMIAMFALAITFWGAGKVIASDSILKSSEGGVFPDAEQVAEFLDAYLQPGDQVVTVSPSVPLAYYADRLGTNVEYYRAHTDAGRMDAVNDRLRLILVLNTFDQQAEGAAFVPIHTIDYLIEEWGIDTSLYNEPEFVRDWPYAEMYIMQRKTPIEDSDGTDPIP